MRCIAVDWSGAKIGASQRNKIWLAEAEEGQLTRLEHGRNREQACRELVAVIRSGGDVVIGLDFAFSYPEWFLRRRRLHCVNELWELAKSEGEEWLERKPYPFWGGGKSTKPAMKASHTEYRETDEEYRSLGYPAQSTFKLNLPGAVGTGTVRGLPFLLMLQDSGAAIWPFEKPGRSTVVEIYPRLLYGNNVKKAERQSRSVYLSRCFGNLNSSDSQKMKESDDAFDAGISALVMSANADTFAQLEPATGAKKLEGEIWAPERTICT